jgi:hypothetical protein
MVAASSHVPLYSLVESTPRVYVVRLSFVSARTNKLKTSHHQLILDHDVAACMDSTVTVTTVLSAVVAKAWWEDGHTPKNLQQYMKDGILTM